MKRTAAARPWLAHSWLFQRRYDISERHAYAPEELLTPTPSGVCCKPGGFHIDPTRPVDKAVITHGHSDHARPGHGAVLATQETLDMMRLRYGDNFAGSTQAASPARR